MNEDPMFFDSLIDAHLYFRQKKLKETDHWGLADYPATTEQLAYRQALRDMPTENPNWPDEIIWPTKPE